MIKYLKKKLFFSNYRRTTYYLGPKKELLYNKKKFKMYD
jgi:hypothetical protein